MLLFLFGCVRSGNIVSVNFDSSQDTISSDNISRFLGYILMEESEEAKISEKGRLTFAFGKSFFYVLDKSGDYSISIFDYSGHFIDKLNFKGDGLGQYVMAYDLVEDSASGLLVVLDPTGKVIRYSVSDAFSFYDEINFKNLLPAAHSIGLFSEGIYVLYSRSSEYSFYVCSFSENTINPLDYNIPVWLRLSPFMSVDSPFYNYQGELFYFDSINGSIYRIDRDRVEPYIRWDLGDFELDKKDIASNQSLKYYINLRQKGSHRHATPFYQVLETEQLILAKFMFRNLPYTLVYYKKEDYASAFYRTAEGKQLPLGTLRDGIMYIPVTWDLALTHVDKKMLPIERTNSIIILKYSLR